MEQNSVITKSRGQRLRNFCLQGLVKRGRCCAAQLTVDLIGTLTPSPKIVEVRAMLESLTEEGTLRHVHDPVYLKGSDDLYQRVFELNTH
jgi:hypothetical protein